MGAQAQASLGLPRHRHKHPPTTCEVDGARRGMGWHRSEKSQQTKDGEKGAGDRQGLVKRGRKVREGERAGVTGA